MKELDLLLQGNKRFVAGQATYANQSLARLKSVAAKQEPMGVILCCSDSRVSPEIIFDQGLGDIFVIRCAGAVAGQAELASLEYAVSHLHVKLILALGHKRCGAVAACLDEPPLAGAHYLSELIAGIKDNIGQTKGDDQEKIVDQAVRKNTKATVASLGKEDFVKAAIAKSGVALAAGYFDLDSGVVSII